MFNALSGFVNEIGVRGMGNQRLKVLVATMLLGVISTITMAAPDDTYYNQQNNLRNILADEVADRSNLGSSITVAVLDTGIEFDHPDLSANLFSGRDFVAVTANGTSGSDVDQLGAEIKSGTTDPNGHGTHITGIIAAALNGMGIVGVAPAVKVLPVRIIAADNRSTPILRYANGADVKDAQGQPMSSRTVGLRYAVNWAKQHATEQGQSTKMVINASFGADAEKGVCQLLAELLAGPTEDILIVAAAMNDAENKPYYPAACTEDDDSESVKNNIIAVGNVTLGGARGANTNTGSWITLSAPGEHVLSSTNPMRADTRFPLSHYQTMTGTSQSAALVSGAAAAVWSRCPRATAAQVKNILSTSVAPFAEPAPVGLGAGVLSLDNALSGLEQRDECRPLKPVAPANFHIQMTD